MKKEYSKPTLVLKGFYINEKIAGPIPTPPGDLNSMGLNSDVSKGITSYLTTSDTSSSNSTVSSSPVPES